MRTLSLLRHAKSSWDNERLADFDRPLSPRGRKSAKLMGRQMRKMGLIPDRVLCSPAARTRETAELVMPELGRANLKVDYDDALYEAEARALMARLERTDDGIRHLLVIGHNPGFQELALMLAGDEHAPDRIAISEKLPTGALVVLELAPKAWSGIKPRCGRIVHFVTPRKLEGE
jgi:phosphohistidine phosphatase